ncbi:biosynthetic peptidoglycan transglycosylase [Oligoflexus tunisiensis]|uniref:biosynthetic peptidoglycan transglycosylase n=1 Tax=Oligoflexus tunisiensis TaxID=708132 RepID=UPI000AAB56FA|nr:biosynthetic peptidoglycan transglycosylase [Oligoflexus tunisiensis]
MDFQSFKRFPRNIFAALLVLILASLMALALLIPPVWDLKEGAISIVRWPKSGPQTFEVGPGKESWVPIDKVSRHVINAIVVAEDARFYEHAGLDFTEIRNSIAFNMEKKRYARGASTITQQVVKMVFLGPEKSLLRKLREALGAIILEWILDKDRILEWYINLVEFGDGVFGIKSAAEHFFETTPELLTIQDGAPLALVLPSPNRFSRGLRQRQLTTFGHRRYAQIIDEMYKLNFITPALRESALATGDFGKPIEGYNPNENMKDEFIDPYVALPGDDPQPFAGEKDPPRKKRRLQDHQDNIGKRHD